MSNIDRLRQRAAEARTQYDALDAELRGIADTLDAEERSSTPDEDTRTDELIARMTEIDAAAKADEARAAELERLEESRRSAPAYRQPVPGAADDSLDRILRADTSPREMRDIALRSIERFGKDHGTSPESQAAAERLARSNPLHARHIATYGSEVYGQAWAKRMTGRDYAITGDEARALTVGSSTSAGTMVPTHLDPTIMLTNAGSYNPFRRIARVETLPNPGPNAWNGVTSAGVTAAWAAESAAASDAAPATAAVNIPTIRAQANIVASYEAINDVANLEGQVLMLLADAKDRLEAAGYATGTGSTQPTGIVTQLDASTFVEVSNTTAATLGLVDLHAALNGLAARFRDRATWVMSPTILGTIQQLGTAVSASFSTDVTERYTQQLLGRPIELSSSFPGTPSSTTQVENWLVVGDFGNFVIVDKIGLSTIYNPVAVNGDGNPTGSGQWYAYWRTGSEATHIGTATSNRAFVLLQDKTSA